jgi:nitrite reductase (NADH) small subunit
MSMIVERPVARGTTDVVVAAGATAEAETVGGRTRAAAERAPDAGAVAWRRACRVDDLEPGWGEAVLLSERQIALFRLDGRELYAVDHIDPKTSAPVMARGIVGSKGERATVASPLLKQVYDLATGECLSEQGSAIGTYRTRVVAGFVEIEVAA